MPAVIMIGGPKSKVADKADEADREDKEEGEEEEGGSRKEARQEASRALIKAMKNGDVAGVDQALEAHYEACEGGSEE